MLLYFLFLGMVQERHRRKVELLLLFPVVIIRMAGLLFLVFMKSWYSKFRFIQARTRKTRNDYIITIILYKHS